jgi:hypothetical protein
MKRSAMNEVVASRGRNRIATSGFACRGVDSPIVVSGFRFGFSETFSDRWQ